MTISAHVFEIASLAPKSAIGLSCRILAEEQYKDEKRRKDSATEPKKCMEKRR